MEKCIQALALSRGFLFLGMSAAPSGSRRRVGLTQDPPAKAADGAPTHGVILGVLLSVRSVSRVKDRPLQKMLSPGELPGFLFLRWFTTEDTKSTEKAKSERKDL